MDEIVPEVTYAVNYVVNTLFNYVVSLKKIKSGFPKMNFLSDSSKSIEIIQ